MSGDPSDVCARCGHDRDDHYGPGGACMGSLICHCEGFIEGPAGG